MIHETSLESRNPNHPIRKNWNLISWVGVFFIAAGIVLTPLLFFEIGYASFGCLGCVVFGAALIRWSYKKSSRPFEPSLPPSSVPSSTASASPSIQTSPQALSMFTTPNEEIMQLAGALCIQWQGRLDQEPATGCGGTREHNVHGIPLFFSTGPRSLIRMHGSKILHGFHQRVGVNGQEDPRTQVNVNNKYKLVVMYNVVGSVGDLARLENSIPRKIRLAIAHCEDMVNNNPSKIWTDKDEFVADLRTSYKRDDLMIGSS